MAGESVTVLTFNIFFGKKYWKERAEKTVAFISELNPTVVALQETTPDNLQVIYSSQYIKNHYHMSPWPFEDEFDDYDTVMLVAKHVGEVLFKRHKFPTRMGRSLLSARFNTSNCSWMVASSHFESLDSAATRKQQIGIAAHVLKESACDAQVLCGDFNFCSWRNFTLGSQPLENDCLAELLPEFSDMWPALHPGDPGYTFDSMRNGLILREEQMRYDRILYRLPNEACISAEAIDLIATDPISEALAHVWASDHFGLLGKFGFNVG